MDRCRSCGGNWFDDQELSQLLGFSSRDLRPLQTGDENGLLDQKRGQCPRDRSKLLRVYSADNPSVVIDSCLQCNGIWLDGGELQRLLEGRG